MSSTNKRFAIASAIVIVVAATATVAVLLLFFGRTVAKLHCLKGTECGKIAESLEPTNPGKPQTVMLLGSDARKADPENERSDTLMLVRLDPSKGQIAQLSFPRDLKVEIPGHGPDKLNAAYAIGGVNLSLKVIKQMTGIKVNHVVNINFRGFKDVVNAIGCVYYDVDRRYYHSNIGLAPSQQYAEIDVPPGYQRLCGQKGLDLVRFRHDDGDFVRIARQQSFIREARRTIGTKRLFEDRDKLIKIYAKYTTSDIRSTKSLLRLVKLVLASAGDPFHSVKLNADIEGSYVVASQEEINRAVEEFMGRGVKKQKKRKKKKKIARSKARSDLENGTAAGIEQAAFAVPRVGFPVMYPKMRMRGSQYQGTPRVYPYFGSDDRKYMGVKFVLKTSDGSYYGVMETSWRSPPILHEPSETRKIHGRRYMLYFDRSKLRIVAFRTKRAVYWVSNTLENKLTSKEMIKIAASLRTRSDKKGK